MLKKIITTLLVIVFLISAVFAGNSLLKKSESKLNQDLVFNEQKESPAKQSEECATDVKNTEKKEEIVVSLPEAPEAVNDNEEEINFDDSLTCTLSVKCSSVLENMHKLKENKKGLIPNDGIILNEIKVEFFPDESVFDILYRELKNHNIHLEFVKTPAYNSVYIEGIANLYEFDCGELSGWLYKVNGIKPTYGCSEYKLKNNDKVEFIYTCNMFE